jgi:hypothetical protein
VFKIFYSNGIYWIGGFNDLIYSIENLITGLLVECPLVVQVQEIVYTGEESLYVKAWQGESLNLCHGSKGPWLKVSLGLLVQHKY